MRRTTGLPFLGGRFNPIRPSASTTIALKGGESGYTLLLLRRVIYHDNLIGETRRADGHVSGHGWELTLRRKFRLEVEPPFSYGSSVDPEEPSEDIRKVARLALMQSPDLNRLKDALTKRFDRDSLAAARGVIASALEERGLIGKLYIDASDFPGCDRGASQPIEFVRRFAKDARFVVAKTACGNCVHAMTNPTGGQTCSVFHKEIQIQVPYTEALAAEIHQLQQAKGKAVIAHVQSTVVSPKQRIALYLLAKAPANDNPDDESSRMCQGVIPNTFIACGEGDDWTRYYCSEACERRDKKRRGIVDC